MEKEIVTESTYRHERLTRWVLPSLLFHLLIIFMLFLFEQEQQRGEADVIWVDDQELIQPPPIVPPAIPQPQQPEDDETPFSLHLPKSSTFGATSVVGEEATFAGDPQSTNDQAEPTTPSQESEGSEDQPQQQLPPPSLPQEIIAQTSPTPTSPPIPLASAPTPSPLLQQKNEEEKREEPRDEHVSSQPTPETPLKRRIKNFWGQTSQSTSPITKKMSLTTLAEGFLDYAKDAQSAIDINSKDAKLEPTLQKIGWFLQNSFHLHNKPIALNQDIRTSITLHLEIDAQGNLLNTHLSPQTNIPSLDRNLLRIAQGAAPFPPIPQHVLHNNKTFKVKIPIAVDARQGTHEYYFLFRG